jgi:hypothetical protein
MLHSIDTSRRVVCERHSYQRAEEGEEAMKRPYRPVDLVIFAIFVLLVLVAWYFDALPAVREAGGAVAARANGLDLSTCLSFCAQNKTEHYQVRGPRWNPTTVKAL